MARQFHYEYNQIALSALREAAMYDEFPRDQYGTGGRREERLSVQPQKVPGIDSLKGQLQAAEVLRCRV